ncbi:MAG: hypothetical protein HFG71_13425 [Hungatella sp.]|nr:hypothetical protein [Hungatella sp.]
MRKGWKRAVAAAACILCVGTAFPAAAAPGDLGGSQSFPSERDYELSIYDVGWDGDTGYAEWTDTEDANRYEVKVYRGKNLLTKYPLYATDINYNLGEFITQKGIYTFHVRAVYSNNHKGDWAESDEWDVDEETAKKFRDYTGRSGSFQGESAGQWVKDGSRWWYQNKDGSYTADNWQYIDNKWYYFDSQGYMATGWVNWKDHSYFCGKDGAMWASCWTPDGYYVDSDGMWVQGYQK